MRRWAGFIASPDLGLILRRRGRWVVCSWDNVWRPVRPLRKGKRWRRPTLRAAIDAARAREGQS